MDKVQKIREEVEKLKSQLLRGACSSQIAMETICKEEAYNEVLSILNSLQEEPSLSNDEQKVSNAYSRKLREKRVLPTLKGDLKHKFLNEFNTLYQTLDMQLCDRCMKEPLKELCLSFATWGAYNLKHIGGISKEEITKMDSLQEEPVSEKKCMFTKDSYTDEDRKVLCKDCKEKCKYNKKEEPISEDLEEASKEWLRPQLDKSYANYGEAKMMELTHFDGYAMFDAIEFGAKWQKEQIEEALLSEVLPCFMHGGEADEVVAKLDEVLNQKKKTYE